MWEILRRLFRRLLSRDHLITINLLLLITTSLFALIALPLSSSRWDRKKNCWALGIELVWLVDNCYRKLESTQTGCFGIRWKYSWSSKRLEVKLKRRSKLKLWILINQVLFLSFWLPQLWTSTISIDSRLYAFTRLFHACCRNVVSPRSVCCPLCRMAPLGCN